MPELLDPLSVRIAAKRMLDETGQLQTFAMHCRAYFGWTSTQRSAEARVHQWLSSTDPHQLPAEVLPILVRVCTPIDHVTPVIHRAAARACMEGEELRLVSRRGSG